MKLPFYCRIGIIVASLLLLATASAFAWYKTQKWIDRNYELKHPKSCSIWVSDNGGAYQEFTVCAQDVRNNTEAYKRFKEAYGSHTWSLESAMVISSQIQGLK